MISLEGRRLFLCHIAAGRKELLVESADSLFGCDDGGRISIVHEGGRVVAIMTFGWRATRLR